MLGSNRAVDWSVDPQQGTGDFPAGPAALPDKGRLVSIIIACYNSARFLREAIESAFQQTYRNIEVIVVDDGSEDASPEIAQEYPVRYIRQENRGPSAARNLGLWRSRGSYIIFLDSDDRLLPDAVETGVRELERHPHCSMVIGEHRYISEDGAWVANSNKDYVNHDPYLMLLERNFIETVSSAMYRRGIFDRTGGFDPSLNASEDYELYFRIARQSAITGHRSPVSEYRVHNSSLSSNSERMLTITLQVIKNEAKYIQDDQAKMRAYRLGLKSWRRKYGRQLTLELVRSRKLMEALRQGKLTTLAREYPFGVLVLLLTRLVPNGTIEAMNRWRHARRKDRRTSSLRYYVGAGESPTSSVSSDG